MPAAVPSCLRDCLGLPGILGSLEDYRTCCSREVPGLSVRQTPVLLGERRTLFEPMSTSVQGAHSPSALQIEMRMEGEASTVSGTGPGSQ